MPFPLPVDPEFRKEVIQSWVDDIADRLSMDDTEGAQQSLQIALRLYVNLPAGKGDVDLETQLISSRVKLSEHTSTKPNANSN